MKKLIAEVAVSTRSYLGEGPLWDEKRGALWYVDITQGLLNEVAQGKVIGHHMGKMIGTAALTHGREILVALEDGVYLYHPATQKLRFIHMPIPRELAPDMRFNDGKCDPQGRFWVGSLCKNTKRVKGSLYRMDGMYNTIPVLYGLGISNGMGWNPQQDIMYFIDTSTREVSAFHYNPLTGDLQNRRTVITIAEGEGGPDGMTVDAEGMLWIAQWGGWQVSRYNPATGEKLLQIDVPAALVSCCTFGGPNLDTLYITTAGGDRHDPAQPMAGALFSCVPGVKGVPTFRWNDTAEK